MVRDHTLIVDDLKTRLTQSELKYEELLRQYHKKEESLQNTAREQVSEVRDTFQDEISKLQGLL